MPLYQILLIGVGIILLIVIFRLYHLIFLLFTRLIFGKCSSRYFALYKRYTGKSPQGYCIKDDFINYIAGFYKDQDKIAKFSTEMDIQFQDCEFGTHFKKILTKRKKPFCVNSNRLKQFDLKVIGFKGALFAVEMKYYYFFVNGKFFLGQLTFKNPDQENIEKIIGVISKKYLLGQTINSDHFMINGRNNTKLYCCFNGFYLTISYLCRADARINELLDEYWESTTNIELNNNASLEEELMQKL